jgi:hypothetical protein
MVFYHHIRQTFHYIRISNLLTINLEIMQDSSLLKIAYTIALSNKQNLKIFMMYEQINSVL